GIVEAVGARLHEYETHEAEPARELEIIAQRRTRRCVTQVAAVRITAGRPEHVEMRVARLRRRCERGFQPGIGIVGGFGHGGFTRRRRLFDSPRARARRPTRWRRSTTTRAYPGVRAARRGCQWSAVASRR